jgi:hypothetical protein
MEIKLMKLKGMTPEIAAKWEAIGIITSTDLFNAAIMPDQRKYLAECAGADEKAVLELANRADLARLKGIAGVYGDLLEEAGVDTVKELKGRVPENLHAKLVEIAASKGVQKPPTLKGVKTWVAEAKRRRKFLQY